MNHISTDELRAFIEDDVRDTVRMKIEIHLGSCESCRNALDELCVAPVGTEATTSSEQELINRLSKVAQASHHTSTTVDGQKNNVDGTAVTTYPKEQLDGVPPELPLHAANANGPSHFDSPTSGEKPMTKPLMQKPVVQPVSDYHPVVDHNPYVSPHSSSSIVLKILGAACILFFIGFMVLCVSYVGFKKSDSSDAYKVEDRFDPRTLGNPNFRNTGIKRSNGESKTTLVPTDQKKPKESELANDAKGNTGRRVVLNPRTESPVDQMSAMLNNIIWDSTALKKQFDLGTMEYDYEKNQVHWGLRINGNHKEYLSYRFRFLNKEGKKIDELSPNGNGVEFWPKNVPSNGGYAGVRIDLPAKSVLQKTEKIIIVETEF